MSLYTMSICFGQSKIVQNSIKDINSCEGKIELTLVNELGGDNAKDESQFFVEPYDVEVDGNNLVYILDKGNNRIQIFDELGNFKKSIGSKGRGPGEMVEPVDMTLDNKDNLIINDFGNRRVQIFNLLNENITTFKLNTLSDIISVNKSDEIIIAGYMVRRNDPCPILLLLDYKGETLREIGNRKKGPVTMVNCFFLSLDAHDNIYLAYYYNNNKIEKYSSDGNITLSINFEVPFDFPDITKEEQFNPTIDIEFVQVSCGISIDGQGRIYLISTTRKKTKQERQLSSKTSVGQKGAIDSQSIATKRKADVEISDLFKLLVFNSSGKIIAAQRLNHYCDKIKIYNDKLFIIDTFLKMKVYEYKISF